MIPRWFRFAPVFAQLLPSIAAIRNPSRSRARLGIVAWSLVLFLGDAISWWLGAVRHQNNLWVGYLSAAISGAVLLGALSSWQIHPVPRLAFRVLIPLYLLLNVVLLAIVENVDTFSLVTETLDGVLLLSLILYTLVVRSLEEREHLTRFDWFWVCSGLALYFSDSMAISPMSRLLIGSRTDLVWAMLNIRAVVDTVAMTVIARGLLCPLPLPRSGGSSSPPSSRSLSYS